MIDKVINIIETVLIVIIVKCISYSYGEVRRIRKEKEEKASL